MAANSIEGLNPVDIHLKQRIVGAFVLLALAAIILSLAFSVGNAYHKPVLMSAVMSKPPTAPKVVVPAVAKLPTLVRHTSASDTSKKPQRLHPTQLKPVKFKRALKSAKSMPPEKTQVPSLPAAWVVQLASFTQRKNAVQLRQQLSSKGFTAYIQLAHAQQGKVYRVYVGPVTSEKHARSLLKRLDKAVKLKGLVVAFNQEQH